MPLTKKLTSSEAGEKALQALSTSSLGKLSQDEILMVLKDDGVESVDRLVARLIETIREAEPRESLAATRVDIEALSRTTPLQRRAPITHRIPKMPFIKDGVEYDPKDISRFDGKELHFVLGSLASRRDSMLAFEDRGLVMTWLQIVYLSNFAGLKDAPSSASSPSGTGIQTHGTPHESSGGGSAYQPAAGQSGGTYQPARENTPLPAFSPSPTPGAVQMFDQVNFHGNELVLDAGKRFRVLSQIVRGKSPDHWDNRITSTLGTTSLCAYFEGPDSSGMVRVVAPTVSVFDMDWLGWAGTISSVLNMG